MGLAGALFDVHLVCGPVPTGTHGYPHHLHNGKSILLQTSVQIHLLFRGGPQWVLSQPQPLCAGHPMPPLSP